MRETVVPLLAGFVQGVEPNRAEVGEHVQRQEDIEGREKVAQRFVDLARAGPVLGHVMPEHGFWKR